MWIRPFVDYQCFGLTENQNPAPNIYIIREPKEDGSSMTYRPFSWPSKQVASYTNH